VTDRFAKAVEQLGSDKLDVRIGGIYALERVARDSAKDHPTVMEVLTAFIREHSREPWRPPDTGSSGRIAAAQGALSTTTRTWRLARTVRYLAARSSSSTGNPPEQERVMRPDVQAAATVIGRRDAKRDIQRIDLTRADLAEVDLIRARLDRTDLTGANLTGANLADAVLGPHMRRAVARVIRSVITPTRVGLRTRVRGGRRGRARGRWEGIRRGCRCRTGRRAPARNGLVSGSRG